MVYYLYAYIVYVLTKIKKTQNQSAVKWVDPHVKREQRQRGATLSDRSAYTHTRRTIYFHARYSINKDTKT